MNSSGSMLPSVGMLPTQQRLDPDHAEVVEVVDRLVGEAELIVDECRTEVELELHAAGDLGLHLGEEDLVAVLAGRLGVVQRDVGVAQELAHRSGDRRRRCRRWC